MGLETMSNATLSLPRGCVQVHSIVQTAICLGGGPPLGKNEIEENINRSTYAI